MNAADIAALLFVSILGWFALGLLCLLPLVARLLVRR